jgi:hypothetical protein
MIIVRIRGNLDEIQPRKLQNSAFKPTFLATTF